MGLLARNLVLAFALMAVPLSAELVAAMQGQRPSVGVNLLLYWPIDFALLALALASFVCLNVYGLRQRPTGAMLGVLAGLLAATVWVGSAILVVFQVHLWRGGQL
jgi:hypothetical protein